MDVLVIVLLVFLLGFMFIRGTLRKNKIMALVLTGIVFVLAFERVEGSWLSIPALASLTRLNLNSIIERIWYAVPFGIIGIVSWGLWGIRWLIARTYDPG